MTAMPRRWGRRRDHRIGPAWTERPRRLGPRRRPHRRHPGLPADLGVATEVSADGLRGALAGVGGDGGGDRPPWPGRCVRARGRVAHPAPPATGASPHVRRARPVPPKRWGRSGRPSGASSSPRASPPSAPASPRRAASAASMLRRFRSAVAWAAATVSLAASTTAVSRSSSGVGRGGLGRAYGASSVTKACRTPRAAQNTARPVPCSPVIGPAPLSRRPAA